MPEVPTQITDSLQNLELEVDRNQRPHSRNSGYSYSSGNRRNSRAMQEPSFSHFPVLRNLPRNVPPQDEVRLDQLTQERDEVLNSNDPEGQLDWAQSALLFVKTTIVYQERLAAPRPRPPTPAQENSLKVDAMSIIQFLADQGHPRALFAMGQWYEFGDFGYREDKREAFRLYAEASEKGMPRAEYRLGMQYENSNDIQNAIAHYQRGIQLNDSASYYVRHLFTEY